MIHDMKSIEFAEEVALPMEQLRSWGREELQEDPHFFFSGSCWTIQNCFVMRWCLSIRGLFQSPRVKRTLGNLYLLVCLFMFAYVWKHWSLEVWIHKVRESSESIIRPPHRQLIKAARLEEQRSFPVLCQVGEIQQKTSKQLYKMEMPSLDRKKINRISTSGDSPVPVSLTGSTCGSSCSWCWKCSWCCTGANWQLKGSSKKHYFLHFPFRKTPRFQVYSCGGTWTVRHHFQVTQSSCLRRAFLAPRCCDLWVSNAWPTFTPRRGLCDCGAPVLQSVWLSIWTIWL